MTPMDPAEKKHEICGLECPRHEGKVCLTAYVSTGNERKQISRALGIMVIDASMRHRHGHTESIKQGGRSFLISHSWGRGGHLYAFGNGPLRGITEDLYDALVTGAVDMVKVDRLLFERQGAVWKAGGGLLDAPKTPLDLTEVVA